jgi:hypothetical protein
MRPIQSAREFLRTVASDQEKNRAVWFILIGILYFIVTALYAGRKFWFDEVVTFYVARLPGMGAVWKALMDGADFNPPLFFAATRAAIAVFGAGEYAVRIPAMFGFFALCSGLYLFVSRRAGTSFGFAAMLLPMVTGAFVYATEARAYGMMLGFCGVALVAWQRANDQVRRAGWLALLTVSLTAALLTHCYAVLMLVPFGLGALVRDCSRRRMDWGIWLCLVIPAFAVLSYLPLLSAVKSFAVDNPVFRPDFYSFSRFYDFLLSPAVWPLLGGAVMLTFAADPTRRGSWREVLPTHELAAALGFLLVPALAILLAVFVSHIFMLRYGLGAVIGVAILVSTGSSAATGRSKAAGAALVLLLGGWFAGSAASTVLGLLATPQGETLPGQAPFEQLRPELPVVISSGLLFLELDHYAPPAVAGRLHYLMDDEIARKKTGSDVFDKSFLVFRRWFPIRGRLEDYKTFLAAHPKFLLYGYSSFDLDWLIPELIEDGAKMTYLGQQGPLKQRTVLFEVESPGRH